LTKSVSRRSLSICALVLPLAGCAAMQNTLAQDLAWERWKQCDNIPGVTLKEIKTDGQIWVLYTDNLGKWQECDRLAGRAQGARRATAPSGPPPVASVAGPDSRGPATPRVEDR
jgi:hypothetical protein